MTDKPIIVKIDKIGVVTMKGDGPWSVRNNNGSFDIIDVNKRYCPPDVITSAFGGPGKKTQKNMSFAKINDCNAIIEAANSELEKRGE